MMLRELADLLREAPADASKQEYRSLIVEHNVLGKETTSTRAKTATLLVQLYALDARAAVFRLLRFFWPLDLAGQPLLAALCAHARDSLLRRTAPTVLEVTEGQLLTVEEMRGSLERVCPGRFSPKMLRSAAQNLLSSYAQSGHLRGHRAKKRSKPAVTAVATAYALALGHLTGARGQLLFDTYWCRLLDIPLERVHNLAEEAHRRGWLDYRRVGSVVDVSFTGILTASERRALLE